jgi:hypothetical protein
VDQSNKCWHCCRSVDAGDAYCRHCGKGQGPNIPFRYTHGGIIVLSLLIGPLTLPFILKSPKIGRKGRVVYAALNLALTLFMLGLVMGTVTTVNRQVGETVRIMRETGIGIGR